MELVIKVQRLDRAEVMISPSQDSFKDSYDPQLSGARSPPPDPQDLSGGQPFPLQGVSRALDPHSAELWLQHLALWLGESPFPLTSWGSRRNPTFSSTLMPGQQSNLSIPLDASWR